MVLQTANRHHVTTIIHTDPYQLVPLLRIERLRWSKVLLPKSRADSNENIQIRD